MAENFGNLKCTIMHIKSSLLILALYLRGFKHTAHVIKKHLLLGPVFSHMKHTFITDTLGVLYYEKTRYAVKIMQYAGVLSPDSR